MITGLLEQHPDLLRQRARAANDASSTGHGVLTGGHVREQTALELPAHRRSPRIDAASTVRLMGRAGLIKTANLVSPPERKPLFLKVVHLIAGLKFDVGKESAVATQPAPGAQRKYRGRVFD